MPRRPEIEWSKLPLFADDKAIGTALLGAERAGEFTGHAALLEPRGFPTIDPRFGGRFVPAVLAFFYKEYGLSDTSVHQPSGVADPSKWKSRTPAFRRRA